MPDDGKRGSSPSSGSANARPKSANRSSSGVGGGAAKVEAGTTASKSNIDQASSGSNLATGFLGAVIGGVVVAAAGFFYLDRYVGIDPNLEEKLSELENSAAQFDGLSSRVAFLEDATIQPQDADDTIANITASLSELTTKVDSNVEAVASLQSQAGDLASAEQDAVDSASLAQVSEDLGERIAGVENLHDQHSDTLAALQDELSRRLVTIESSSSNNASDIAGLESGFKSLSDQLSKAAAQDSVLSSLEGQLGETTQALGSLRTSLNATVSQNADELKSLKDSYAELEQKISKAETDTEEKLTKIQSLLRLNAASTELEIAQNVRTDFSRALAIVESMLHDDDVVSAAQAMKPYEKAGLPTLSDLRTELGKIGASPVDNSSPSRVDGGWLDQTEKNILDLVQTPATEPSPIQEAIRSADQALAQADIERAISSVETIANDDVNYADEWLAQARARVASNHLIQIINARINSELPEHN